LAAAPAGALAQEVAVGRSILSFLPTDGRVLAVGEHLGALGSGDVISTRGARVQAWVLRGAAGDDLVIDLLSDAFDAYLFLEGPGFEQPLTDDDGGGACNARIAIVLPEDGEYRVVVSSVGEAGGAFTLRVADEPVPTLPGACDLLGGGYAQPDVTTIPTGGRVATSGDVIEDRLTASDYRFDDGTYGRAWSVVGRSGQRIVIDLISTDFDAFLYFAGPGLDAPRVDDDGAGACDARIVHEFIEDGDYVLVASSVEPDMEGAFTLRVSDVPGPVSDAPCESRSLGPDLTDLFGDELAELPVDGRALAIDVEAVGELDAWDPLLSDGTPAEAWSLAAAADQVLTIDVVSTDFDALLYVQGPGGLSLSDDDSLGSCNPRLIVTVPEDGELRIVVNAMTPQSTGTYVIRASTEPGPTTPGDCVPS
jgi:hypothetical protein